MAVTSPDATSGVGASVASEVNWLDVTLVSSGDGGKEGACSNEGRVFGSGEVGRLTVEWVGGGKEVGGGGELIWGRVRVCITTYHVAKGQRLGTLFAVGICFRS